MDREKFINFFCEHRKCAPSSARTTFYALKRVRKLARLDEKIPKGYKWINKKIYEKLKTIENLKSRKNVATALVSYLKVLKAPKTFVENAVGIMMKLSKEQDLIYQKQQKSTKQERNWITPKKIRGFLKEKASQVKEKNLYDKASWTPSDKKLAMNHLMLVLHSNNPPRLEFSQLVYTEKQELPPNGNWLYQKKRQWFALINNSKTSRKKGPFLIKFANPVSRVLNLYKHHFKAERPIFTSKTGTIISRNNYGKQLTKLMQDRFGKKVSASLLRTIFLSDKYAGMPRLKEMQKTANDMGHSIKTAMSKYVKI